MSDKLLKILTEVRKKFKEKNIIFFKHKVFHKNKNNQIKYYPTSHFAKAETMPDLVDLYYNEDLKLAFSFAYHKWNASVLVHIYPNYPNFQENASNKLDFKSFRLKLTEFIVNQKLEQTPSMILEALNNIFLDKKIVLKEMTNIEKSMATYIKKYDKTHIKQNNYNNAQQLLVKKQEEYNSLLMQQKETIEIEVLYKKLRALETIRHHHLKESNEFKSLNEAKIVEKRTKKILNKAKQSLKDKINNKKITKPPKAKQVINFEFAIEFNENKCIEYLNKELSDEVERQFVQAIYLSLCKKHFGLEVKNKAGVFWLIDNNIDTLDDYVQLIAKKIKNIDIINCLTEINKVRSIIFYEKKYDLLIEDKVYSELFSLLEPTLKNPNKTHATNIFSLINLENDNKRNKCIHFNEKICIEYLQRSDDPKVQEKLCQALLFLDILALEEKLNSNKYIVINKTNHQQYYDKIGKVLLNNLNETQVLKYLKEAGKMFNIEGQKLDHCVEHIIEQLNCDYPKHAPSVLSYIFADGVQDIIFNEKIFNKLLKRSLKTHSLKELSKVYFLYYYQLNCESSLITHIPKKEVSAFLSLGSLGHNIEQVKNKLKEQITDEVFDQAVNEFLNNFKLSQEQEKEIAEKVLYKAKNTLGLTPPKLFKHYL